MKMIKAKLEMLTKLSVDWQSEKTAAAVRSIAHQGLTIEDAAEHFGIKTKAMSRGIESATPELVGTFVRGSFWSSTFGRGVLSDSLRVSKDYADLAHHLHLDSHRDARKLIKLIYPQIENEFNIQRWSI
jgi:hypothetical protein